MSHEVVSGNSARALFSRTAGATGRATSAPTRPARSWRATQATSSTRSRPPPATGCGSRPSARATRSPRSPCPTAWPCAPPADPALLRGRRDGPRHRARGHDAARAQPAAVGARLGAAQPRRHRRADRRGRDLHRHPRHGRGPPGSRQPGARAGARDRRRRRPHLLAERERRGLRGRAGRTGRARGAHLRHAAGRARVPAARRGGRARPGRRARPARRRRGRRPRRVLLVPAHRHRRHQAQQPHRRRRAGARTAGRVGGRRAGRQRRLRAGLHGSAPRSRGSCPSINRIVAGQFAAAEYVDRSYRVFTQPAPGAVPGDGVRRAPRGAAGRVRRAAARGRAARAGRHVPGRGAGGRRPTTSRCPPRPAATAPTSPSTCTAGSRTRPTSARSRPSCATSTGARTGASCTPAPPPTCGSAYPGFDGFVALRDRLDPERRFGNAYLERVLG